MYVPPLFKEDRIDVLHAEIRRTGLATLVTLGTDGFGRSDNREHLRRHFEIDAESIVAAALSKLAREGTIKPKVATQAFAELGLNPDAADAATA